MIELGLLENDSVGADGNGEGGVKDKNNVYKIEFDDFEVGGNRNRPISNISHQNRHISASASTTTSSSLKASDRFSMSNTSINSYSNSSSTTTTTTTAPSPSNANSIYNSNNYNNDNEDGLIDPFADDYFEMR